MAQIYIIIYIQLNVIKKLLISQIYINFNQINYNYNKKYIILSLYHRSIKSTFLVSTFLFLLFVLLFNEKLLKSFEMFVVGVSANIY
jgi:hypothetical protein